MRLKNTVKILKDNLTWIEVPGEIIPFKIGDKEINLLLHESIQPWTPNQLDVSEETTGCLCANTGLPVSVASKKDAEKAFQQMLEDRGVDHFLERMKIRQQENLTR